MIKWKCSEEWGDVKAETYCSKWKLGKKFLETHQSLLPPRWSPVTLNIKKS